MTLTDCTVEDSTNRNILWDPSGGTGVLYIAGGVIDNSGANSNIEIETGATNFSGGLQVINSASNGIYYDGMTTAITIDTIYVGTSGNGNGAVGVLLNNCTGVIDITGLSSRYNATDGLQFTAAASANASSLVTNSVISNNTNSGIVIDNYAPKITNSTINLNVEDGIQFNNLTDYAFIKGCTLYDNGDQDGVSDPNSGDAFTSHGDATGFSKAGAAWDSTGNGGILVNNTFYNNQNDYNAAEIAISDSPPDDNPHYWKNNIIVNTNASLDGSAELLVHATSYSDIVDVDAPTKIPDFNCYYGGGTSTTAYLFKVDDYNPSGRGVGAVMTYAEYVAGGQAVYAGFEANSMYADPLFTDAASGNFTLQSTSPCINAGAQAGDVGLAGYDTTYGYDRTPYDRLNIGASRVGSDAYNRSLVSNGTIQN